MNLRKKSRSKLRIFGSFSSKMRRYRSETDLQEKSTPVLLGVRPHSQDLAVRPALAPPSSATESRLPASRSYSMSVPRQTQLAPVSLLSLPQLSPPTDTAEDISLFERQYLDPHHSPSLTGSDQISHTDSGAWSVSCQSSPSPTWPLSRDRLDRLPPLLSPPLVLSVTRGEMNHRSGDTDLPDSGRVTVTVGTLTRLCINDTLLPVNQSACLTQYQSLPNLNIPRTERQTGKHNKMPHMGLSRLVNSPSKLPAWQERSRITTSTATLLNRSNTMDKGRTFRETSCCSDTSSGVFSEAEGQERIDRRHQVTVNGQLLQPPELEM